MPDTASLFRVLILDMPTLLGDLLVAAMANQPDIEVIRELDFARASAGNEPPNVVIVGRAVPDEEYAASILLSRWPRSLVVAIERGGRGVLMYELQPTRMPVEELSPEEIVDGIRSMVRRPQGFRTRKLPARARTGRK